MEFGCVDAGKIIQKSHGADGNEYGKIAKQSPNL